MKKKENISYVIIAIFIIALSLPLILSNIDKKLLLKTHPIEAMDFKLESDPKDIPLVQRIHRSYNIPEDMMVTELHVEPKDEERENLRKQLEELIKRNILFKKTSKDIYKGLETMYIKLEYTSTVTNVKEYGMYIGGQKLVVWLDIETQKIIFIQVKREGPLEINYKNEFLLEDYLDYLNLDLLEDWNKKGEVLESNKASIMIKNGENEEAEIKYLGVMPKDVYINDILDYNSSN